MSRRALLAAVCWVIVSALESVSRAEDAAPGRANVFTPPPAPASEEPGKLPEGPGQESPMPAGEPSSAGGEIVVVPAPSEADGPKTPADESETVDSGITIRIGPEIGAKRWSDLKDFAHTRWRPFSQTKWMPGHRDRFGMFSMVGNGGTVLEDWGGLIATSGWGVHFLNGPVRTDLPSKVFDFNWGMQWNGEITSDWSVSLSGQVGLFTDFEDSVRDGWRFPAHAVVFHDWNDAVQGVAGVKYLDRENLPPLPVFGVILRPVETFRLEAIFPEPRAAFRIASDGESENWLTISGEIGGGEWAIERSNTDLADIVTYNDYSAVLGFHTYSPDFGNDLAFEIGYTFARDLEYRSGVGDFEPQDTFFVRWSNHF